MPNNRMPGILEDFVRFMVPPRDDLWSLADASVTAIPPKAVRFPSVRRAKVVVHTWLAWQEEPGLPLGTAITARYLDTEASVAQGLMAWLTRLFT